MSNEGGRRLIRRLLAEYEVDHIGLSDNERECIAEARALLAAPDAATVRADVAKRLRAEADGFRATAADLAAGLDAPVTLGAVIDGLDDLARRIEAGD